MDELAGPVGRRRFRLAGAAVVLGAIVYLGALHGPFVYDDHRTIVENRSIRDLARPGPLLLEHRFRPLVNLSYALDYALWGLSPVGYHLTSVLLHLLNVALIFRLVTSLLADARARGRDPTEGRALPWTGDEGVAFATAALFAVHPMMTEAVSYASGRAEVLSASFFLAGFLAFRRVLVAMGARTVGAALLAFGLALAAKEVALVLPLVVLAYDRLLLGGSPADRRRRLWRLHLPLVGFVAALALVRLLTFAWVEPEPPPVPWWQYGLIELPVFWRYVGLLLVPAGQSIVHAVREVATPLEPAVVAAAGGLLALGALAWRVRRRAPLVSLGIVWLVLLLAPSSSVIPLNQAMAEHRVYLASVGLLLAVSWSAAAGLEWLRARGVLGGRLVPRAALIAVLAVLSLGTFLRNLVWADPVALWREAALRAPDTFVSHWGLGEALRLDGQCRAAIPAYERAARVQPEDGRVLANLAVCLMEVGRLDEADAVLGQALRIDPGSARTHTNLGVLALRRGEPDRARDHFRAAALSDPRHVPSRQNLAALHEAVYADPAEALRLCREIEGLAPGLAGVADCVRRNEARVAGEAASPPAPRR